MALISLIQIKCFMLQYYKSFQNLSTPLTPPDISAWNVSVCLPEGWCMWSWTLKVNITTSSIKLNMHDGSDKDRKVKFASVLSQFKTYIVLSCLKLNFSSVPRLPRLQRQCGGPSPRLAGDRHPPPRPLSAGEPAPAHPLAPPAVPAQETLLSLSCLQSQSRQTCKRCLTRPKQILNKLSYPTTATDPA